ncbi:DUF6053 domain-containing protein [Lysobacter enzymogenes]
MAVARAPTLCAVVGGASAPTLLFQIAAT